ncbi:hypothetical protein R3P38DRAFT_2815383 [Favolaschia claudopus]|uniref:Uncharacterized protein n=1 Tax=Favolaschia claudopus TaxID=2862362 RepID=A0AAV9Z1L9_9AGAR
MFWAIPHVGWLKGVAWGSPFVILGAGIFAVFMGYVSGRFEHFGFERSHSAAAGFTARFRSLPHGYRSQQLLFSSSCETLFGYILQMAEQASVVRQVVLCSIDSYTSWQPFDGSAQRASAASGGGSTTQWAPRRAQPRAAVGVWGGKPQTFPPAKH